MICTRRFVNNTYNVSLSTEICKLRKASSPALELFETPIKT